MYVQQFMSLLTVCVATYFFVSAKSYPTMMLINHSNDLHGQITLGVQ